MFKSPSPSFAPRPDDRFAFIEDDDAAGSLVLHRSHLGHPWEIRTDQGEEKLSW